MSLNKSQKKLRERIVEISYNNKLSHIGSCLNVVDLIDAIFKVKGRNDKFILSAGHSAIALYVVLEKYIKSVNYDKINSIHPDRPSDPNIDASTGSLGQGLPIAVGMSMADRNRNVYCLISDGEMAEGSIWESLRIAQENSTNNLTIVLSANGYGAYDPVDVNKLKERVLGFGYHVIDINGHKPNEIEKALKAKHDSPRFIFARTSSEQLPFLRGQAAHYYVMKDDLKSAKESFT